MSYWKEQPVETNDNNQTIQIIMPNLSLNKNVELPDGFSFKTLGVEYLDEIYNLITNHYIVDKNNIYRVVYAKKYLYWYLKKIPHGFIVGLTYKNKLVGIITAIFIDMIIYDKEIKVPFINFFCCQPKIRKLGLSEMLMDEIKRRLIKIKITYAIFSSSNMVTKPFCTLIDYIVPINYSKLRQVGFLTMNIDPIPQIDDNPLHLMQSSDTDIVVTKLNTHMQKLKIKPYFTNESVNHYLIPKKNIVYSFVKRDKNHDVTDFVCVYKNYLYCLEKNRTVSVANLAFYFCETMTLTELITCLLNKLPSYSIDQLTFRNTNENSNININKFSTHENLYYFFYNVLIKETNCSEVSFYPF